MPDQFQKPYPGGGMQLINTNSRAGKQTEMTQEEGRLRYEVR